MGVPERREREKSERREAILAGATRVFLEKGVASATMEDIARESELSKGALYLYFKNKDELFLALALGTLEDLRVRFEAVVEAAYPTGIDRVRALLLEYVDFALTNAPRFRVAMSWLGSSYTVDASSELFAAYQEGIQRVHAIGRLVLDGARADGSLAIEGPLELLSLQVWGSLLGVLLVEQNSAEIQRRMCAQIPISGLARSYVDLIVSGLSCPAAKPPKAT